MLFLPYDDVFLCYSLYSYKDFYVIYGKNGTMLPVDIWSVCVKAVPKKTLKRHLLSSKIAMLLILVKTFYAVLLA